MKKNYKALCFLMCCVFCAGLIFAGGKTESGFELTEEQKKEGWRYFMPLGIKIQRPAFWDKYEDYMWVDQWGDDYETPDQPLFKGFFYLYMSEKATAEYERLQNVDFKNWDEWFAALEKDVFPILKPVYGLFCFRTELIAGISPEKLVSSEVTSYPTNYQKAKILKKGKDYTQVLGYNEFNADDLTEAEQAIYKEMLSQLLPASETVSCTTPMMPQELLLKIKNLQFDTIDLTGNKVTSEIFKDYDVTMINMWATWCGPCRAELPEIGKLYEAFKDKKCNVIGITGDLSPDNQDVLETAKKIVKDAACKYTVIQNNDSLTPLFKGLPAWPTTIFVDKNGTIIASGVNDIIVGSRTLDEFTEAMNNALQKVQK